MKICRYFIDNNKNKNSNDNYNYNYNNDNIIINMI